MGRGMRTSARRQVASIHELLRRRAFPETLCTILHNHSAPAVLSRVLAVSEGRERSHYLLVASHKVRDLEGAQAATTSSYSFKTQRIPELRFSATLGQEPEIELALA